MYFIAALAQNSLSQFIVITLRLPRLITSSMRAVMSFSRSVREDGEYPSPSKCISPKRLQIVHFECHRPSNPLSLSLLELGNLPFLNISPLG